MAQLRVQESALVNAPPAQVYAVLADYEVGHPAILPRPYFDSLMVEKGGQGAGTEIQVRMKVFGTERVFYQFVSEPEPGRVLVESDPEQGVTTTFTVEPVAGGQQSRVTIATESRLSPGFQGLMERLMSPGFLRRVYRAELQNLDTHLHTNAN